MITTERIRSQAGIKVITIRDDIAKQLGLDFNDLVTVDITCAKKGMSKK
jgi:hypothetical protein